MKTKMIKRVMATTLAVALVLPFTSQAPSEAAAKAPKLTSSKGSTYVGFVAKTKIGNIKKNNVKKLTVKASNNNVSVSKSGLSIVAKGLSKGSSTITATLKLKKAVNKKKSFKLTYKVTVSEIDELASVFGENSLLGIDFTKAYVEYLKTLDAKDFSDGLNVAVVNIGVPLLLMTDTTMGDGSSNTARVFVYNPLATPAAVTFVDNCTSNSTAYPVLASSDSILYGSHHYSSKMTVDLAQKKGSIETVSDLYMDKKELTRTVEPISFDGTIGEMVTDTITIDNPDEPGEYDHYNYAWSNGLANPVIFTRISD